MKGLESEVETGTVERGIELSTNVAGRTLTGRKPCNSRWSPQKRNRYFSPAQLYLTTVDDSLLFIIEMWMRWMIDVCRFTSDRYDISLHGWEME